tara:strand:- start:2563 stop:3258 length:696 start_codon:yes stop_codon:yes gene_type:complete
MIARAITIKGNNVSVRGYDTLVQSSKKVGNRFDIEMHEATTADIAEVTMRGCGLKWTYPWEGQSIDFATGLTLSSYTTAHKERRIACFMSHYRLWHECIKKDQPILVLEHDALFVHKLDYQYLFDSKYDIIGINNPLMATRRAQRFYDMVKDRTQEIQPVPDIDEFNIPQGLAGNSAYIIKPNGARNVIEAAKKYGAWPNDALMCKQIIPNMGVTRRFYTKVQGLPSTTTG